MRSTRLARTGTVISQTVNAIILNGNPDESISARSYRRGVLDKHKHWAITRTVIDKLVYVIEKDHCEKAWLTDYGHAQALISQY